MEFEYYFSARGYELDSYNHVNHAVYLNYFEQARWEILKELDLINYLKENKYLLIVSDIHIRYMREIKIFDELVIKTVFHKESPYLVFIQKIYNKKSNLKVCQAKLKTLLIDENKIPCDFPDNFLK